MYRKVLAMLVLSTGALSGCAGAEPEATKLEVKNGCNEGVLFLVWTTNDLTPGLQLEFPIPEGGVAVVEVAQEVEELLFITEPDDGRFDGRFHGATIDSLTLNGAIDSRSASRSLVLSGDFCPRDPYQPQ